MVNIIIENDFIKIINDDLSEDETERKKELDELFYDYKGLNSKTLLTETGYDRYLMSLTKKQTQISGKIKNMYSRYKQEYDKLIDEIMNDNDEQENYVREYTVSKEYILKMIDKHFKEK